MDFLAFVNIKKYRLVFILFFSTINKKRKDFAYKLAKELIDDNYAIAMGIVDLKKLVKNKLRGHAKAWHDLGLGSLNNILKSKASKHNMVYHEVDEKEAKSTQTCSGPKGLKGLGDVVNSAS